MGHLPHDALSAYSDGELPAPEAEAARAHLSSCASCRHELASFGQLDALLAASPALSCAVVRPLLSALVDEETDAHEAAAVSLHLTACADCRAQRQHWLAADAAIRSLPAGLPSARVDAAIAALGERTRRVAPARRRVLAGPAFAGAVASGLMAVVAVMGGGQAGVQVRPQPVPAANTLFGPVAVQQVLNTKTNTLYALRPDAKAVAALDPFSKLQRALIPLAAKPITLALNEDANRVYVVDVERSLSEIDGATNAVVSTTPNVVTGTPTAISYDPAKKQIVVAASVPAKTAAPITSSAPTASPPTGEVVVLDSSSKRTLESRTVDAAPQIVVLDEAGAHALLVSSDGTRVVNAATYEVTLSLPGGVAGAFATNGHIGVLSSASGGSRVMFFGTGAPGALDLEGAPVAMTALPHGGYGVLVDVGGRGRVYTIDAAGRVGGRVDVNLGGRILTYDAATQRFAVIGGEVSYAALPAASGDPSTQAAASPGPTTAPATSAPAATAQPSATPQAIPTATPTVAAVAKPSSPPLPVPAGATLAWTGMYRVELPYGKRATVAAVDPRGTRIWFVDQNRTLNAMTPDGYKIFPVAQLPAGASIDALVVGYEYVYAIDKAGVQLYQLSVATELVTSQSIGLLRDGVGFAVTPNDTLWFGRNDQLLSYDPRTRRIAIVGTGAAPITAVGTDSAARVWFAGGKNVVGSYDTRGERLTEYALPRRGAATALALDGAGALWVATDGGELFSLTGGVLQISAKTAPGTTLSVSRSGAAWTLRNAPTGGIYAPVDGSRTAQAVPGSIQGLIFDQTGRAWLLDRTSGVFYVTESAQ